MSIYGDTEALSRVSGRRLNSASLAGDTLRLNFEGGPVLELRDDGQLCCEHRYMRTDDDLSYYAGSAFLGAETRDGGVSEDEGYGDVHQIQFLDVRTDRGVFTLSSHNKHNGFYGGFSLTVVEVAP